MIEQIERLSPKLQVSLFHGQGNLFEQSHIPIETAGIGEDIPARISKRQALRRPKSRWVVKERPQNPRHIFLRG
jgi:hypothetical protein